MRLVGGLRARKRRMAHGGQGSLKTAWEASESRFRARGHQRIRLARCASRGVRRTSRESAAGSRGRWPARAADRRSPPVCIRFVGRRAR